MSALPSEADIRAGPPHVCFVPLSDSGAPALKMRCQPMTATGTFVVMLGEHFV
jgi:hypothetical protein